MLRIAAVCAFLAGCEASPDYDLDQRLRTERFEACMKLLPAGPTATKYNDWAEVVSACDFAAHRQALVCVKNCRTVTTPASTEGGGYE